MVNYRSATNRTIPIGRYQITHNPGVDLDHIDEQLESLVTLGILLKNNIPETIAKQRVGRIYSEWNIQVVK